MLDDAVKLEVIKPGLLIRSETGVILDARSTVTLIQSDVDNILVDTALRKDRDLLIQALKERNLSPGDINIIIITHCHRDHIGNNKIFPNARIYAHFACTLSNLVKIESFPYSLARNIEIIETPGHSWDSISVIVRLENKTYAITGDAIPIKGNYIEWIPPIVHVDAERALESMNKIVQVADVIIPGHEPAFKNERK